MQDPSIELSPELPLGAGRYQINDLVIDTRVRQVTRGGVDLAITGLSFDLLWALVRTAPHLVSFDALMEQVWPGVVVGPEAITQRVMLLRQALGDSAESPRYIFAVRGHGYRMSGTVVTLGPSGAAPGAHENGAPPGGKDGSGPAPTRAPLQRWLLPVLILVVVVGSAWWGFERWTSQPPQQGPTGTATFPAGSVAVMPFANLTGDAAKEYFSDGMAEEMINALGQVPGLKVPGRTSSFAYKGRNLDLRQIGQDLHVSTVLEGSVRSAGSRIRISAQLVDARSGYQIWSQSYDRESEDIFKLQDELAGAILKALKVNLSSSITASIAQAPPTQNVEAYDLYLQGQAMIYVADHGRERALERYQRAVALDPKFARAYLGIALTRYLTAISTGPPIENLAEATRFAQKAMSLDPNLEAAQGLLANIAYTQGHWLDAAAKLRAALALGQGDGMDEFISGLMLLFTGHLHEALDGLNRAVDLNPAQLDGIGFQSMANSLLGRDADAVTLARLGAHLGATRSALPYVSAMAALRARHYAEAATLAGGIMDPTIPDQARTAEVTRLVFAALSDPGKKALAMGARSRLYPRDGTVAAGSGTSADITSCLQSSYTYALLGELDTVFDMANQCLDAAAPGAINSVSYILLWQPEMGGLREDPRFATLATRLGLMEYWEKYGPPDGCDLREGKLTCH